jgi:rhamnose transport system substrate-binding protein
MKRNWLDRVMITGATAAILLAASAQMSVAAQPRYAMLVRVLGNTAFELAKVGATQAAKELGVDLIYTGPTENTAEGQIAQINSLVDQHVDAIMITANDQTALLPALQRAQQRGVKVVSWDQDLDPTGRTVFIAEATNDLIALAPLKIVKNLIGTGEIGVISGAADSTTQNDWVNKMIDLTKNNPDYKGIVVDEVTYGDEKSDKAYNEALGLVSKYPNLKVIVAYSSVAIAAASKMVEDQHLVGKVAVTGLGFPNEMVDHVLGGATPAFAIWNMVDVGYTTMKVTDALVKGQITGAKGETVDGGRMGKLTIGDDGTIVMGELQTYDKTNVKQAADLIASVSK